MNLKQKKKKTLNEKYAEAVDYLIKESNKVLPFVIDNGARWKHVDNDLMAHDFLYYASKVVIHNFNNFKESVLNDYIKYAKTHYKFYYKKTIGD